MLSFNDKFKYWFDKGWSPATSDDCEFLRECEEEREWALSRTPEEIAKTRMFINKWVNKDIKRTHDG